MVLSLQSKSQQFIWANSYDISNSNEVAALAIDISGNTIISGVHDASAFLPYTGNCYIHKTNQEGDAIWTEYLLGDIQIGDMATIENSIVIIGQSNGSFSFQGEQYGGLEPFLFLMKIDSDGNLQWFHMDETKYGANTNIEVGEQGNIAIQVRGQFNLGDWIWIMDTDGNILNTKEISSTQSMIVDLAYFNDKVYLNGGFTGPSSIIIDTVFMPLPNIESATFVLMLNEELIAEWASVDTTINNRDGRIKVNSSGIFVYEEVLNPPFNLISAMKKFSFDGELLIEVKAPVFSNAISLYPDMSLTSNSLGLMVENDFNFNSHKVMLFDLDLNLISEKVIEGNSDLYTGQIANNGNDFFIAHVFSGNLNFDNEVNLPYNGSGKLPYIAMLQMPLATSVPDIIPTKEGLLVYPSPADKIINVRLSRKPSSSVNLNIIDLKGNNMLKETTGEMITTLDISMLPSGMYIVNAIFTNGKTLRKKIHVR
jgi:hypothetical protein